MKIDTLENYIKVTANEGFYLTSYQDGDDIIDFNSFKIMYAPIGTDTSNVREITEAENEMYYNLQEIKLRELEDGKTEV